MSRYSIIIPTAAPPWAAQMQAQFNDALIRIQRDMKPKRFAKLQLPTDGSETVGIVTDEAGGEVLAFLDSAGQWRRSTDRAVVS